MSVHILEREQFVPAPLDEVFPFFAQPENLGALTPPSMGFEILTPQPLAMKAGALIDYRIRLGPLPMRWRTLITEYDPPHRFVDEQLRGPYDLWHHTHTFAERDGGTVLGDRVVYALPLGPLGELVHALVVRRQLDGIFAYRFHEVAKRFGGTP
jgi:hypothetical protein